MKTSQELMARIQISVNPLPSVILDVVVIHRRRREGPADNDLDTSPCTARKTDTLGTTAGQTDRPY